MSAKESLPPLRGERVDARRQRVIEVLRRLHEQHPNSGTALAHNTPFQLLIATILSAQCTDERVNLVTPALFSRFGTAPAMAGAPVEELEVLVQPTGFFRQKAKNIRATAQRITDVYGGEVPCSIAELTTLAGVARKTANVLISNCFPEAVEGIAVDTHVQRIARRLGWTRQWVPDSVERDLMRLVPLPEWNHLTHLLIEHGRGTCRAPTPRCGKCPLVDLCPSAERWLG